MKCAIGHRLRTVTGIQLRGVDGKGDMTMKNATAVKDLVCGMDVDTATAAGCSEYKGQTYFFCGARCKEKFDLNPAQYVGKAAGTPKSGPSCCS
jgi:YHS domain-containing protein